TTVLNYLREEKACKGTKEGCAEGDCGACTVVLAELANDELAMKSVNACIQFVTTLNGKAVFTVEYLRQQSGGLHPVQQAMVDCHGSQCGFCTPGFVMSLWGVYNEHQTAGTRADKPEIRSALTGNLCRCTGYRPILEAAEKMFDLPAVSLDRKGLTDQLKALQHDDAISMTPPEFSQGNERFFAPTSLDELLQLKSKYPEATILAGGTDVGLWINKQFRDLPVIIYIGEVPELKVLDQTDNGLVIGAGVTLSKAYQAIHNLYPEMDHMWERFASQPIRNIGTLGGNVANGSPIGDSMPALIAVGATVTVQSVRGSRDMPLEGLYLDYMKKDLAADEIVAAITLPQPATSQQFRCYKLSKRQDSDISAVFAAFSIVLDGDKVKHCKIAFGGMAATPKRAGLCEQLLVGATWGERAVQQAMQLLQKDYQPLSDMRASDQNRMQSAMNLLYRFYLETRLDDPLPPTQLDVFGFENQVAGGLGQ
ncbi:MAG: xanthine dehydrogenase small subunit, partial [Leucothrix sp.]